MMIIQKIQIDILYYVWPTRVIWWQGRVRRAQDTDVDETGKEYERKKGRDKGTNGIKKIKVWD